MRVREIDELRKTLARLIALTGCRKTEAINVRYRDIDLVESTNKEGVLIKGADVTFHSLKRRKSQFRTVTAAWYESFT